MREVLQLIARGHSNADEAERLLTLIDQPNSDEPKKTDSSAGRKSAPKYLRIEVRPDEEAGPGAGGERVNIRVPMGLIRAGVKLATVLPSNTSQVVNDALEQQGLNVDLRNLKPEDLEHLIDALGDLEVDIHDDNQRVRVYTE